MKTKTFLMIYLLSGIGLTQLSGQNGGKNEDHSYLTKEVLLHGVFPITCNGSDFEMLDCYGE